MLGKTCVWLCSGHSSKRGYSHGCFVCTCRRVKYIMNNDLRCGTRGLRNIIPLISHSYIPQPQGEPQLTCLWMMQQPNWWGSTTDKNIMLEALYFVVWFIISLPAMLKEDDTALCEPQHQIRLSHLAQEPTWLNQFWLTFVVRGWTHSFRDTLVENLRSDPFANCPNWMSFSSVDLFASPKLF